MDIAHTKKKKKTNKKKEDLDPIIKKKVKHEKAKNGLKEAEQQQDKPVQDGEEEEKLNYDKFMDLFKASDSKLGTKVAKKKVRFQNKVNTKEVKTVQYPRIELASSDKDTFDMHFGLDQGDLIEQKLELVGEKMPENMADKALVSKDFSYAFEEEDEDLEVLNTQQEIVTNQVKMKEYDIKQSLKGNGKLFEDQTGEVWVTDAKIEAHSEGKSDFVSEPSVHPAFHVHAEMEQSEEDSRLKTVFPIMESYYDLIYTDANEESCTKFRRLWIIHALNHIKKALDLEDMNKKTKKEGEDDNEDAEATTEKLFKFKGYTKARILVIVPYKGDAFEIVSLIKEIYTGKGFKKKSVKAEKFLDEFGNEEDMLNDDFKFGMAFNEDKMSLYCPFSKSDIIIASPLGLRRVVGAEGDKEREYSFLSSIEIMVMERAHVIFMQNWQHMGEIMGVLNRIPRHKDMTNDINEIREYYFENLSKFYRQNIVYTEFKFPELNSLVSRHFQNFQGLISNRCFYDRLISETEIEINQEFMKFDIDNFSRDAEQRFEYFKAKVWDKIRFNEELEKVVLFVNSYFDFLRLRSYFKKINANVNFISEYTERPKAQSRIAQFVNKKFKFLLVTERAYYFSVIKLRNFGHIVFYSLPRNATIYRELIFNIDKVREAANLPRDKARKLTLRTVIKSLFTKYDALTLERIVGTDKCKEYIAEYNKGTTFIL